MAELLHTDTKCGLSNHQVEERLAEHGYNEFKQREHITLWQKFIGQFKSFMIIVLLVAAAISGITGYMHGEGITDALIILVILVANAIIGALQEAKAEQSLEALERMAAPQCKVIRNGERRIIPSRELVPGDIVELETGDCIPADLRLTEAVNLKVQEAALTGESVPVEKCTESIKGEASIGDRVNMAFASCSVTYGRGRGIVVSTGNETEMRKIAAMIESVPEQRTPMQERLDQLGLTLAVICLVVCGVIFIIGMCYGRPPMEMFMTAVSLAVAHHRLRRGTDPLRDAHSLDAHPLQAHCPHLDAVVDGCRALPWRARHERIFQVLHKTPKITINKQAMIGMGAIANIPIHSLIFLNNEVLNILGTKIVIPH